MAEANTGIILKGAGIAADDAEYNVLVEQYRGRVSAKDWPDMVETFAKSRRGGSAAQVVADTGGSAPVSADQETLSERLVAATTTGDDVEIERLQQELVKAMKS